MAQAQFTRQLTISQFEELFPTDEACKANLQSRRWPVSVRCPRYGNKSMYALKNLLFHWECPACRHGRAYRFSVMFGTTFENTTVGLRDWFRVIQMILTRKKGVATLELQRVMSFGSYRAAHYLCMRGRAGLVDPEFRKLIGGGVGYKDIFMGAVERKSTVVARVVSSTDSASMQQFVREAVSTKVNLLVTDEHQGDWGLKDYPHKIVRHSAAEYLVGTVHTQTIDGFWSPIKRGIMGAYHKISAKYLTFYVAEFEFHYNNRKNPDIFRTAAECL